jgi:DNA-binding transcriptional LysR family regulator
MTPSQLKTFLAVADHGSVHGAAAALVVSQPAVSAALAALQRDLGVALVERSGRGLRLTAAGVVLAGYARRLLGLFDEARVATVASADPRRGQLRVAAVTTAGEHVVPGLLATFRRVCPDVAVVLEVGNRRRVWELVATGGADLAIGGRPPSDGGLTSHVVADNELVLVAAPEEPPRRQLPSGSIGRGRRRPVREVGLADLAGRTWLVREPGSGTRDAAEALLGELDLDPPRLTLGSNGAVCESAAVGLGVALVARVAVAERLARGELEEWRMGPLPLHRQWHVVARVGDLPATAGLWLDHLRRNGWVPARQPE